ncbi:MAG: TspO/MBR family protein [Bacteroidota bacterium]
MKNVVKFIICLFIPLAVGAVSGFVTSSSINTWYAAIQKPWFNPPNNLFGPVWTILYILMGISLFMIVQSDTGKSHRKSIVIFAVQLFLNFCWSFLFFTFHAPGIALVEILFLLVSIIVMINIFYKINKTAALLQIPYLMWVSFASLLNGAIWYLN